MKIQVVVSPDGSEIKVAAVDSAGDAWSDYCHHLEIAAQAEGQGRLHDRNRAVRAAIISLAAHFEGIVDKIFKRLGAPNSGLPRLNLPKNAWGLGGKLTALEGHAERHMSVSLPPLKMRFKLIRDIIAHPGITKIDKDTNPGRPVELSEFDVVSLGAIEVRRLGVEIGAWLDLVCATYKVNRTEDTEKPVTELGEALGEISESPRQI